jgi:hypothetical protein
MQKTPDTIDEVLPSSQKFGWFFCMVFSAMAAYMLWQSSSAWATCFSVLAGLSASLTLFFPAALTPFNRLWFRLGILLGKVVSPIVLALLFFVLITPVAILTRIFGRDELLMKKRNVASYWIDREPAGPSPESFKNQF